jgi:hypothetical protein
VARARLGRRTAGLVVSAPRPPLGFRFDVPDQWTVLDLAPVTSDDWIERFLDEWSGRVPGAAAELSRARQVLRQTIAAHQQAGVLFAAFLATTVPAADSLVAAGLALAWQELAGMDLDALERFCLQDGPGPGEIMAAREVCRLRLRHSDAVRVRSRQLAPVPLGPARRPVAIVQHLVPVPETAWLGVFSLTTPDLDRADAYAELADRVAGSLELLDDSGQPLPSYYQ